MGFATLKRKANTHKQMARQAGFEPTTYGLEGRCSIQLSYWRAIYKVFYINHLQHIPKIGNRVLASGYRYLKTPFFGNHSNGCYAIVYTDDTGKTHMKSNDTRNHEGTGRRAGVWKKQRAEVE